MLSGQGYKRFENPILEDTLPDGKVNIKPISALTESFPGPVIVLDNRSAINFVQPLPDEVAKRRKRHLQSWKFLRSSAAVGLLLACALVVIEGFVDVVIAYDDDADNFGVCGLGTGVWVGALGLVAGVLGVCAFRLIDNSNRALLVAYFVLLIVATVGDGVLIIITAFCVDSLPYVRSRHEWDHEKQRVLVTRSPTLIPMDQVLYAIEALLLLLAFIHIILSVLSSAIMCRTYWCSVEDPAMTVVYVRPDTGQQVCPDSTQVPENVVAATPATNSSHNYQIKLETTEPISL